MCLSIYMATSKLNDSSDSLRDFAERNKRCTSGRPGSFLSSPRLTPHRLNNKQFPSLSRSVLSPHLSSSKFVFCFLNFQGVEQNCRLMKSFFTELNATFLHSFIHVCMCYIHTFMCIYLYVLCTITVSPP